MTQSNWLCQIVEEIDERVIRMELMLDRLGVTFGEGARLKGSNWEVSEFQIAQWVAGTTVPLVDASSYVRFKDGNLEIRGGKFDIHTGETAAHMTLTGSDMYAYDALDAETFHIDFATGAVTLTGTITAGAGEIAGWTIDADEIKKDTASVGITLDSGTPQIKVGNWAAPHIVIDGSAGNVGMSNFAAGVTGWRITGAGEAEFNNITARGVVRTPVFLKDEVAAIGGTFLVQVSDVIVTAATTAGAIDASFDLICEHNYFAAGDYIRCKPDGVKQFWGLVTGIAGAGPYTYAVTLKSGDTSTAFEVGLAVVSYGANGEGSILMTGTLANAPYLSIFTHAAAPWTTLTERVRLGSLTGITDVSFGALGGYGLWTDNGYFTGTIKAGAGEIGGWTLGADNIAKNNATLHSSGYLLLGTGDDVARLDAADATWRLWVGDATAADAPFRVDKDGNLVASAATITGTLYQPDSYLLNASAIFLEPSADSANAVLRFVDDVDDMAAYVVYGNLFLKREVVLEKNSIYLEALGDSTYEEAMIWLTALCDDSTKNLWMTIDTNIDLIGFGAETDYLLTMDAASGEIEVNGPSQEGVFVNQQTDGVPSMVVSNGAVAVDTTNHVFYYRSGGFWRAVSTASDHGDLTGLGDDDHGAVYGNMAVAESITGTWHFDNLRIDDGFIYLRTGADVNHYIEHDATSDRTRFGSWTGWEWYATQATRNAAWLTAAGDFTYYGALNSYKNATSYTGYIYVPLTTPLISTSFNGDTYSTANDEFTIDLSASFGVPAGIKAIYADLVISSAAVSAEVGIGPSASYWYHLAARTQVANTYITQQGICTCDASGDVYFKCTSATNSIVYIRIYGYWV